MKQWSVVNALRVGLSVFTLRSPTGELGRLVHVAAPGIDAQSSSLVQGEDDGTTLVDVDGFVATREGERLTGVYALYDARRSLQYVGYARSVVLAIKVRASS